MLWSNARFLHLPRAVANMAHQFVPGFVPALDVQGGVGGLVPTQQSYGWQQVGKLPPALTELDQHGGFWEQRAGKTRRKEGSSMGRVAQGNGGWSLPLPNPYFQTNLGCLDLCLLFRSEQTHQAAWGLQTSFMVSFSCLLPWSAYQLLPRLGVLCSYAKIIW